jgi:hypothetical protein
LTGACDSGSPPGSAGGKSRGRRPSLAFGPKGTALLPALERMTADEGNVPLCQGALRKRGRLNKAFQHRFFVLFSDGTLRCAKTAQYHP